MMSSTALDLERSQLDRSPLPRLDSSCDRAILIDSLLSPTYEGYDSLFETIDTHPEADVRQRLFRERALRAHYLEAKVAESIRKRDVFRADVRGGRKDMKSEAAQEEWGRVMDDLCVNIDKCSRALKQDNYAANAPVPNEHFMKEVFWPALKAHRGPRAPNGALKDIYGRPGETMPRNLTTPRGCPDDIIRSFITLKMMIPANDYIFEPIQNMINSCLGRERKPGPRGLDSQTLDLIASGIETLWPASLILIVIIVVYNLDSLKNQLIATGLSTLLVLFPLANLSDQAVKIFAIAVAYWATIAVIIFTGSGPKNN